MRDFFRKPDIQERLKAIFIENGAEFVVADYWNECIEKLSNETTLFDDVGDWLATEYGITDDDALAIIDGMYDLCKNAKDQLTGFFGSHTEREIDNEVASQSAVQGGPVQSKSLYYFSPEDEAEIRDIKKQSNAGPSNTDELFIDVASQVVAKSGLEMVIQQLSQKLGEPTVRIQKRIQQLVVSRLKETRDLIEYKDVLSRGWKVGGSELPKEESERVIRETERARSALQSELVALQKRHQALQKPSVENASLSATAERALWSSVIPAYLQEPELPSPGPSAVTQNSLVAAVQEVEDANTHNLVDLHTFKKEEVLSTVTPTQQIASNDKRQMDGVQSTQPIQRVAKTRLTGPVDELSGMTLADFRSYPSSGEAAQRIVEKVELLAADSLLQKKQGVDAWKKSEPYRVYVAMGIECMQNRVTIKELIEQRKSKNLPYLSEEEFSAVADLNRKISFS